MLKALLHRCGLAIATYLMSEVDAHPLTVPTDFDSLRKCLRPGDVLLVEGFTRVSAPIKYLTQSSWSHSALFVGPIANVQEADGERHVLVEADLALGVHSAPLSKYRSAPTRICRPVNLADADAAKLVDFVIERIGYQYDLHNLFDLLRYLLPTPPIPARFRRRSIAIGAASPTRALCSTLLAQAFETINYPILPSIELSNEEMHPHVVREILHVRSSALFVPRDFDISPYFAIVKPMIAEGFNYRELTWARA